ncbi:hypothetical protein PVA17_24245 [Lysinibacillus sp. CNPSo 3705]|uniref:hypothetical protein n=1 Tax=Lysinibacillus sp. CNPSo 3705 TaxID=3028148 RepID=UPI0023646FAA|nr:hypothetical protein [Lysinibacillus sp. CNPSo 3705]MDD1505829.1 hypothetical protein [Lysinibacillus sp. CNPSo 3705]
MEKKDKKFLIIFVLIGIIIALGWWFKRWYFVYKCNVMLGPEYNYGYNTCYYIQHGKFPTSIFVWIGGLLVLATMGFLVFCWMYLPQKAVNNWLNWLNKKK